MAITNTNVYACPVSLVAYARQPTIAVRHCLVNAKMMLAVLRAQVTFVIVFVKMDIRVHIVSF